MLNFNNNFFSNKMDDKYVEFDYLKNPEILYHDLQPFNKNIEKPSFNLDNIKQKKLIFKISFCPKNSLFSRTKINPILVEEEKDNFLKRKRSKRNRKENKDNIRKKIKRGFLNNALIKNLNSKLKSIGINNYFEKFPQFFASDINQKRNKKMLNLTLGEIFEQKELYKFEKDKGFENYLHNLKVIKSNDLRENEIFKNILGKTFSELYEEYLNSDEFKIDEINRIKKFNIKEDYIRRYIVIAKALIKFFSK